MLPLLELVTKVILETKVLKVYPTKVFKVFKVSRVFTLELLSPRNLQLQQM